MSETRTFFATLLLIAFVVAPFGVSGTGMINPAASGVHDADLEANLLDAVGVQGSLGLGEGVLSKLVGQPVVTPQDLLDGHLATLSRLQGAQSGADAYAALVAIDGTTVTPTAPAAQPLTDAIVRLYANMGADLTLAEFLQLRSDVNALDPAVYDSLAVLVTAINDAHVAMATGNHLDILQAAGDLVAASEYADLRMSTSASHDSCLPVFMDPDAFIEVAGPCDDHHDVDRMVLIDQGGNDLWENNAGGARMDPSNGVIQPSISPGGAISIIGNTLTATLGLVDASTTPEDVVDASVGGALDCINGVTCTIRVADPDKLRDNLPVAVAIDMGGNDVYQTTRNFVQGSGSQAIGILFDAGSGTDNYTAGSLSQGAANNLGVGVLIDGGGKDNYDVVENGQGSSDSGFLIDLGGDDTYTAGPGSQGGRRFPSPTALSTGALFDANGDDTYFATGNSQGSANFLIDGSGNDHYTSLGSTVPTLTSGYSQGVGLNDANGALIDGGGNDTYYAEEAFAHGFAFGAAAGALVDVSGKDSYTVAGGGQGYCISGAAAPALLFDGGGDDLYDAGGVAQGVSSGQCVGYLVDVYGDDTYKAGDHSQGATLFMDGVALARGPSPLLAALIDGGGDDTYEAGDDSQGSARGGGVSLLADVDGVDSYMAGHNSQGHGGLGVGLLVDGVQDLVRTEGGAAPVLDGGSVGVGVNAFVLLPGDEKGGDTYDAGDWSQGSSGEEGGIGALLDNDDESEDGGGIHESTYTAGHHSQGAAANSGIGALVDLQGRDAHTAGAASQGSADGSGLGVLVDASGKDDYNVDDDSVSRGWAVTVGTTPASSLLLDLDNDADMYSGFPGDTHNGVCERKGTGGLTVDVGAGMSLPTCLRFATENAVDTSDIVVLNLLFAVLDLRDQALGEVFNLLSQVETTAFPEDPDGTPCDPTGVIYCDNFDSGAPAWTPINDGLNDWRLIDDRTTTDNTGAGPDSGDFYWYVGAPAGNPGTRYITGDGVFDVTPQSYLVSPPIDLTLAVNPELTASLSGESELNFDFLQVGVYDSTTQTFTALDSVSGPLAYADGYSVSLAGYAGQSIQVAFTFKTDEVVEVGTGWNVDTVVVAEA